MKLYSGHNLGYIFIVLFISTDVSPPQWLKHAPFTFRTWVRAPSSVLWLFFHIFLFLFCIQALGPLPLWAFPFFAFSNPLLCFCTWPNFISYFIFISFSFFILFSFHIFFIIFIIFIIIIIIY